jgi:hypothetical protein
MTRTTTVLLDGRFVGLVQADLRTQRHNAHPPVSGSWTWVRPCTVELPNCTTGTLLTGADTNQCLWPMPPGRGRTQPSGQHGHRRAQRR